MSVYDFNKHEFVNNHNHLQNNYLVGSSTNQHQTSTIGVGSNGNNNCQAIARYQVENSYLNRGIGGGFPTSAQHMDMSGQSTRPTSKTAMLVRQRRAMLEQLSCYLCKGFLIDATTVDECMDSFCKSCIVKHLREFNTCPKCHTIIHKTNPLSSIRSDKVLQDIVYKLIPGLYDNEMKRRREFYKGVLGTTNTSSDDDDADSFSSFAGKTNSNMSSEQYGIVSHPKPFYKPTDVIKISIEPHTKDDCSDIYYDNKRQSIVTCFRTGNAKNNSNNNNNNNTMQQQKSQRPINWSIFSTVDKSQFKTYLRCEAKLTTMHLKKFIAAKFNASKDDIIHLLYLNETVQEDYSLIDIAYIYDWRGIEHMRLFYIIERDLSNMENQGEQYLQQQDGVEIKKVKLSRQNAATSTQPIKRVCIDPRPQYYDDKHKQGSSISGRNMRSTRQNETGSFATRSTSSIVQAPILRSSGGSQTSGSIQMNSQTTGTGLGTTNRAGGVASSSRETRQQASAIEEHQRAKLTRATNETRSTRKNVAVETTTSNNNNLALIPKTNATRNSTTNSNTQHYHHQLMNSSGAMVSAERSVSTYSKANGGGQQKLSSTTGIEQYQEPIATTTNYKQLVPSSNTTKCSMVTTKVGSPAQSSVVTLASFTEARSNHVMSMTTSSATAITNSYRNMMGVSGGSFKPIETRTVNSAQAVAAQEAKPQTTSTQVAFSFVTERGITIVRRLPQRDSSSTTTTLSTNQSSHHHLNHHQSHVSNPQISRIGSNQQPPALPAPPTSSSPQAPPQPSRTTSNNVESGAPNHHHQQQQQQQQRLNSCIGSQHKSHQDNHHLVSFSSSTSPRASSGAQSSCGSSGGHHSQEGGSGATTTTARHLIKVKPVYKTFVDPTKLKTPNLKKLGFTARH